MLWPRTPGSDFGDASLRGPRGHQPAGDRTEFLGRNGTPDHPALLERGDRPSGRVGAGLDPCAALQTRIELPPGARAEVVFFLGQAATVDEVRVLVTRYRDLDLDLAFKAVTTQWDDIAGASGQIPTAPCLMLIAGFCTRRWPVAMGTSPSTRRGAYASATTPGR